ncbi:MAG: DUF296 domain-containing protein [Candidatus Omnitrophica bacterium]|nr:DUF296 domain-containing protein [Candidatus Omnitrophota bacterium]MDD5487964.1 DUF296 domain-containing protein [Candidatus Omnitrophota bacterium]
MEYREAKVGRVIIVRFDNGDPLLRGIEEIARKENISFATVTLLGALASARMVTGPEDGAIPPKPIMYDFEEPREVLGSGTIIRSGVSHKVHLHISAGREGGGTTGCLRSGDKVFITVEAVITEVVGPDVSKGFDEGSGCNILRFNGPGAS